MTCVIERWRKPFLKKTSPFSPQRKRHDDDQASMTYALPEAQVKSRKLVGDSLWLSRKMVDDGCTLGQTLQVMEELCKSCSVVSPMSCVDQCETWKVKKELRETNEVLSRDDHGLKLLNAIKNQRRLTLLGVIFGGSFSTSGLQKKLRSSGFCHSQKTVCEYLKPLLKAGLVKDSGDRFSLTLYGRKVFDAIVKHGFVGHLPVRSGGNEEEILKRLLDGAKTRKELLKVVSAKSLSRTLRRLKECKLIGNNFPSNRVFYFRTKRALSLERLSQTQKRICELIPRVGISARDLSEVAGINLRRTYKYLRSLRGKKLVFRRNVPVRYELTVEGRAAAEFLEEVAGIK